MIHSEKGRTQMKGNTLDIFSDFRAVNIAMRQFLKNQGATKEIINEIMIAEIFRAEEDEDARSNVKEVAIHLLAWTLNRQEGETE